VGYTYTVTEGEAPADWVKSVPTIDDCRATLTEDSASRFLTDTIGDEVESCLYTNEGRMAGAAYKSCTYSLITLVLLLRIATSPSGDPTIFGIGSVTL